MKKDRNKIIKVSLIVVFFTLQILFLFILIKLYYGRKIHYSGKYANICIRNQKEIAKAVQNYYMHNKAFPDTLIQLYPRYLNKEMLNCPLDFKQDRVSYLYDKNGMKKPNGVVLSCERHIVFNNNICSVSNGDGEITVVLIGKEKSSEDMSNLPFITKLRYYLLHFLPFPFL